MYYNILPYIISLLSLLLSLVALWTPVQQKSMKTITQLYIHVYTCTCNIMYITVLNVIGISEKKTFYFQKKMKEQLRACRDMKTEKQKHTH